VGDRRARRPPLGIVGQFGWTTGRDGKKSSVLVLTQDGRTAPLGTLGTTAKISSMWPSGYYLGSGNREHITVGACSYLASPTPYHDNSYCYDSHRVYRHLLLQKQDSELRRKISPTTATKKRPSTIIPFETKDNSIWSGNKSYDPDLLSTRPIPLIW